MYPHRCAIICFTPAAMCHKQRCGRWQRRSSAAAAMALCPAVTCGIATTRQSRLDAHGRPFLTAGACHHAMCDDNMTNSRQHACTKIICCHDDLQACNNALLRPSDSRHACHCCRACPGRPVLAPAWTQQPHPAAASAAARTARPRRSRHSPTTAASASTIPPALSAARSRRLLTA